VRSNRKLPNFLLSPFFSRFFERPDLLEYRQQSRRTINRTRSRPWRHFPPPLFFLFSFVLPFSGGGRPLLEFCEVANENEKQCVEVWHSFRVFFFFFFLRFPCCPTSSLDDFALKGRKEKEERAPSHPELSLFFLFFFSFPCHDQD